MLTQEVLSKYHARRREDLDLCRKAVRERDFLSIERVGHKLKGNGITFGYPELSRLGESMENASAKSDLFQVQTLILQLENWVDMLDKNELPSPLDQRIQD